MKLRDAETAYKRMGIEIDGIKPNFHKMQKAKELAVKGCTKEIHSSFVKLGITHMSGLGKFVSPHEVEVNMNFGGVEKVNAKNFIIATGSYPNSLPSLPLDEKFICSSDGALN